MNLKSIKELENAFNTRNIARQSSKGEKSNTVYAYLKMTMVSFSALNECLLFM